MDTLFGFIHALFEPFREDLTSLRLNNGPSAERVGPRGRGKKEINAVWHSAPLQRPPNVWFESRLLGLSLCLNMGRVIKRGSSDSGGCASGSIWRKKLVQGWAQKPFIKANLFKRERESIWKDSMTNVDAQLELCLLGFGQLMGTKEAECWHYLGLWETDQHFSQFLNKDKWKRKLCRQNL